MWKWPREEKAWNRALSESSGKGPLLLVEIEIADLTGRLRLEALDPNLIPHKHRL